MRGVSEAFQHVLRGIQWAAGDELVITDDEEAALLVPALQLAAERGVVVRRIALRHGAAERCWPRPRPCSDHGRGSSRSAT